MVTFNSSLSAYFKRWKGTRGSWEGVKEARICTREQVQVPKCPVGHVQKCLRRSQWLTIMNIIILFIK